MAEYSYNGWPASPDKAAIGVVSHPVVPGGAKAGDVTTVLGYVARQFHARVEALIDGWSWGYTYKTNANNPSQLSCHASGTALDLNAPNHPNGSGGTFTAAQVTTIYTILAEVEGAVSWLQGYDEMHFEICVSATTLAGVAARLGTAPPTPQGDPNDMADITDAQMDKIAKKVVDLMWARTVRANDIDPITGKATAKDRPYGDTVGGTYTLAGTASYRSSANYPPK